MKQFEVNVDESVPPEAQIRGLGTDVAIVSSMVCKKYSKIQL